MPLVALIILISIIGIPIFISLELRARLSTKEYLVIISIIFMLIINIMVCFYYNGREGYFPVITGFLDFLLITSFIISQCMAIPKSKDDNKKVTQLDFKRVFITSVSILILVTVANGVGFQQHQRKVEQEKRADVKQDVIFETAIVKQLKEEFPDIKEIKFDFTVGPDYKLGDYYSGFYIVADWTDGQQKSEYYSDVMFDNLEDIQNLENGLSLSLTQLMYKYHDTGKTLTPVLVTFSTGERKKI